MQDDPPAATTSPEDVAQHGKAYRADALERKSQAAKKLDEELRRLEKIEKEYRRPLERALEMEGGAELESMKRAFQELRDERDVEVAHRKAEELQRRHGGLMKRAMARSGIDRKGARRKLLSAISHPIPPSHARAGEAHSAALAADVEFVETDSLGFSLITRPPLPPPSPPGAVVTLRPPYDLRSVSTEDPHYAFADRNTGALIAYSESVFAGSFQTLASLGKTFAVDSAVRRVRVEAKLDQQSWTFAAGPGYASAEAKLSLIVRDGSREVASDRLSLVRTIVVVLWLATTKERKDLTLACEFERQPGVHASYSAIVEAETWAGGGGASCWANERVITFQDFRAISGT